MEKNIYRPEMRRGLVWLRRDLRLHDHHALRMALKQCHNVFVAFVFDTEILQPLLSKGITKDRRVDFIHQSLVELDTELKQAGGELIVRHGKPSEIIPSLAKELNIQYLNKIEELNKIISNLTG